MREGLSVVFVPIVFGYTVRLSNIRLRTNEADDVTPTRTNSLNTAHVRRNDQSLAEKRSRTSSTHWISSMSARKGPVETGRNDMQIKVVSTHPNVKQGRVTSCREQAPLQLQPFGAHPLNIACISTPGRRECTPCPKCAYVPNWRP